MNVARLLKQKCTYWAPLGLDGYGKPSFAAPAVLDCRWEDRLELVIDKRGQEYTSKSRVFFTSEIDLDGYLYLGTSVALDPKVVANAWEIRGGKTTPDLRALQNLHVAFL